MTVLVVERAPFGPEVEDEKIEVTSLDAWHQGVDEPDFDVFD